MKAAAFALVLALPLLAGCGRPHQRVPARDGWSVTDVQAGGVRREDMFLMYRESLTPVLSRSDRSGWREYHPILSIEPREGAFRANVRIGALDHAPAGQRESFPLAVSFDGAPAEPVMFTSDNLAILAPRGFEVRMQRHRLMSIQLPGGDRDHPPAVITYRLDGLGPQLASLDAEQHARREAARPMSNAVRTLVTLLGGAG